MSVAYFILLDNREPGFDTFVNGKFLAQDAKALIKIARKLNLKTLDDFCSMSPVEARAVLEDLGGDVDNAEFPEEQWYLPEEGLTWVTTVTNYIKTDPSAVRNAENVLSDLAEYKEVLTNAKRIGARWHLQVDY